jgi:hypothetical protein
VTWENFKQPAVRRSVLCPISNGTRVKPTGMTRHWFSTCVVREARSLLDTNTPRTAHIRSSCVCFVMKHDGGKNPSDEMMTPGRVHLAIRRTGRIRLRAKVSQQPLRDRPRCVGLERLLCFMRATRAVTNDNVDHDPSPERTHKHHVTSRKVCMPICLHPSLTNRRSMIWSPSPYSGKAWTNLSFCPGMIRSPRRNEKCLPHR